MFTLLYKQLPNTACIYSAEQMVSSRLPLHNQVNFSLECTWGHDYVPPFFYTTSNQEVGIWSGRGRIICEQWDHSVQELKPQYKHLKEGHLRKFSKQTVFAKSHVCHVLEW